MPSKCTAPKIDPKIRQKINIEPNDIEKGDMVDYVAPKNVFWRGFGKVHSIKKQNIVVINIVDEHTHITFRHIRGIYKRNQDNTEWEKFK